MATALILAWPSEWALAQPSTGTFGEWRGLCDPGGCRVSTAASTGTNVRYRSGLRVEIPKTGRPRIVLSPLPPLPSDTSLLEISVDGEELATLPAETGWRLLGGRNDYAVVDPVSLPNILAAMRPGGQITFGWTDRTGAKRSAAFSLIGATAALNWLGTKTGTDLEPTAQEARDPEDPETNWSANPEQFAAAIRACQLSAPASFARVLTAMRWTESEDAILVSDGVGIQRLCIAVRDGSQISDFRPVTAEDSLPPIGPVLTPAPQGPCFLNEPLTDEDGLIIGVISRNIC